MKTKKVTVVPYDPSWPADFQAIRDEVSAALGDLAVGIEHVGSTSVPGLAAKPIIDLDVILAREDDFPRAAQRLAAIGYIHEGDLGIRGREAFRYDCKPHLTKHHLYMCPVSSRELHRHLTFRDYLRSHPEAVSEYAAVKQQAAARYPDSIEKYMEYKSACIEGLYRQCGL